MATLQNLREDYLYEKLPEGIITLDEQNILRALVGGIQDRVEDIRSYAKKYEVLFSAEGMVNTVVLVTFETGYGKVVTRSLDIQDDTPEEEGTYLTTWAADQLGIESSQITSCVFGEDLLRYVDTGTLQYLAATIGAVLYQTAAQAGSDTLNQQKILNSYFPRLKIKGTAMSFDILGKLIGFDDVRMTPLWGRLSPRVPNDIGDPANDADMKETPEYMPQQQTGVAYDPHIFRDGPYYTWTGTVSADPSSTGFYTQTVNGFQPWVKVVVTGSVVHPAIGSSITLDGGSPHTKAAADAGQGLMFQALGEGEDFNGLQVTFEDWNSGTDRLVSITDRLSSVKYRTSYFDLAFTLTDQHALEQFGTTTTKPNTDLQANPASADDGRVAVSPFRPWRAGRRDSAAEYHDFTWVSSGTSTQVSARQQATTAYRESTQFNTDALQAAGQEAVQIMDEVRAATRFTRRSSVGFLNKDDVNYAGYIGNVLLFDMSGTSSAEGIAESHPAPEYSVTARVRNTTALAIPFPTEPGYTYFVNFSNNLFGPYVRISDYFVGEGQDETFYAVIGSGSGFFNVKRFPTGSVSQTPLTTAGHYPVYITNLSVPLETSYDPLSNGTIIRFSDGVWFNGTYDLGQHWYKFEAIANHHSIAASGLQVDAYWTPTNTEVVRSDPNSTPLTQVFAAFGDNSDPSIDHPAYQVGTLVASWQPEFLVMLGDHNYRNDAAKYPNENSNFLPWINDGKVVAIPGNHDLDIDYGKAFYDFFKTPGRYYSRRIGNVEFFAIDDGILTNEQYLYPDWRGQLSEPARWLKEAMSASQAPWKIVMIHHNSYSSANTGHSDYDYLKWPFKDWGADLVLNGHVHGYEHNYVQHPVRGNNGIHILTIGFGGHSLISYSVGAGSYGSIYRYPLTTQQKLGGATRFTVTPTTLKWDTYTVDGTLRETYTLTKSAPNVSYQNRPEDEPGVSGAYEIFDEVPWRRDLVGNGELVEINNRIPPVKDDVLVMSVSDKVAVKDQTGADYTVYGLNSTVNPIRLAAEVNPTDSQYTPGQIPIAYKGDYIDLLGVVVKRTDTIGFFTDAETYGTNSFKLYHAGLVGGVLVADPVSFYGPYNRNGLKLWMPMNEHPDEGAVIHDRSVSNVETSLSGFTLRGSFANKVWDESAGWNLYVNSGTVSGDGIREVGPDFSLSMWVKPDVSYGTNPAILYAQGPLKIRANAFDDVAGVTYTDKAGGEWVIGAWTLTPGEFNYLAVSVEGQYLRYGNADRSTALTLTTGTLIPNYQEFTGTHTDFEINVGDRGFCISDVRVWNRAKTESELEKVRDYQPKETICTYWPTNIEVAGSRDHYGLRVLDNGFITPDVMPPSLRMNQLARVIRYDDKGRYSGENRFNEVGLGGGTPLPATWQLGQQFYEMNSNGTVVVSTSLGGTPYNPLWQLAGNDAYVNLPYSGSTATGIPGVSTPYSAGGTWPPPMDFNNPAREFIWLKGDDNKVYEVNLRSTTTSAEMIGSLVVRERTDDELVLNGALRIVTADPYPQHSTWATTGTAWVTFDNGTFDQRNVLIETDGTFVASYSYASKGVAILTAGTGEVKVYHPQQFRFTDQPTGAVSVLVANGTELSCNYGGYVYQRYTGGTLATPPIYMYLTARTVEDTATGATAHNRWTEDSDLTLYGNRQSPRIAALDENGILEFENSGDMTPGHYRLTIESGAVGRVDDDFDGFSVVLTIDTVQVEGRLLAGYTGADFSGEDVFEFDYTGNNDQNWLLTVQFLNALTDVNRGTGRNLWIKNFKLEKIATELYRVTIGSGPKPTLTQIQTGSYSGTNPGGWLAILNSYGTVVNMVHESNYFPANDTVMSNVPLSGMLTGNTIERREDHYTASSTISVLPDDAAVAMPTFGGIIVR